MMKYFNGFTFKGGKQVHAFVCARTKKRALEILNVDNHNISMNHFNNYWSECGNQQMKDTAMDNEGLWYQEGDIYKKAEARTTPPNKG